jgi:hypothetical protein
MRCAGQAAAATAAACAWRHGGKPTWADVNWKEVAVSGQCLATACRHCAEQLTPYIFIYMHHTIIIHNSELRQGGRIAAASYCADLAFSSQSIQLSIFPVSPFSCSNVLLAAPGTSPAPGAAGAAGATAPGISPAPGTSPSPGIGGPLPITRPTLLPPIPITIPGTSPSPTPSATATTPGGPGGPVIPPPGTGPNPTTGPGGPGAGIPGGPGGAVTPPILPGINTPPIPGLPGTSPSPSPKPGGGNGAGATTNPDEPPPDDYEPAADDCKFARHTKGNGSFRTTPSSRGTLTVCASEQALTR